MTAEASHVAANDVAPDDPSTHQTAAEDLLREQWRRTIARDPFAAAQWRVEEGGDWVWQPAGVEVRGNGNEWSALSWMVLRPHHMSGLTNFVVEVSISGKADAAGISFGPFKDFLTALDANAGKRRLQLEVDAIAGTWTFRVDGRLVTRHWWDSAVRGTADILAGTWTLKARFAEHVLFEDFAIHTFSSSCQASVIMTCHRFQQRLRVALRNWCHQSLASGAFEILVVNPQSPDGTRELIAATARSFSHVRVREIAAEPEIATNKGAMINRGVHASRGQWIWFTDADCLFPPDCLKNVLTHVDGRHNRLFYGQRRYLADAQTDALLSGRLDGLNDFAELARGAAVRPSENAPWGYTQIVHRSVLDRLPYRENINHFAHSDDVFATDCRRSRIQPEQIPGLFCLHLHHPFSWYGTDAYL
jgi:hypothetical protein